MMTQQFHNTRVDTQLRSAQDLVSSWFACPVWTQSSNDALPCLVLYWIKWPTTRLLTLTMWTPKEVSLFSSPLFKGFNQFTFTLWSKPGHGSFSDPILCISIALRPFVGSDLSLVGNHIHLDWIMFQINFQCNHPKITNLVLLQRCHPDSLCIVLTLSNVD